MSTGAAAPSSPPVGRANTGAWRPRLVASAGPWLAQAGLPFLLVVYLGLRGGGYDAVVRSEVGIAVWWIVLLGAAVGALPVARLTRGAWVALGLLAAFAAWTALGITWSESAERSVAELGRVATLLGRVRAGAHGAGPRRAAPHGRAASPPAIALVGAIALLSRLHPAWFPDARGAAAPARGARPACTTRSNYWNGLAAFIGDRDPAAARRWRRARGTSPPARSPRRPSRSLALTAFYTLSRGGGVEIAVALASSSRSIPRRLALAAAVRPSRAPAAALLIAAATQRDALADGLTTAAAASQGDEMLAMTLVVCAGVGAARGSRVGAGRPLRRRPRVGQFRGAEDRRSRAQSRRASPLVIALAAGVPGKVSDGWESSRTRPCPHAGAERFDSAGGSGRYQFWQTALDANASEPLIGIGPGTFEFCWAREGSLPAFVRDAHSLYFETLAELGIVGLLLILALVVVPFVVGVPPLPRARRTRTRAASPARSPPAPRSPSRRASTGPGSWPCSRSPSCCWPPRSSPAPRAERGRPRGRPLARCVLAGARGRGHRGDRDPAGGARRGARQPGRGPARRISPRRWTRPGPPPTSSRTPRPPSLQEALVLELQGDLDGAARRPRRRPTTSRRTGGPGSCSRGSRPRPATPTGSVEAYREARDSTPDRPCSE